MNQTEQRNDVRDTEPSPPPDDTDVLCSGCAVVLVFDELVLEVTHPEPACEGWRHRHAAGLQRAVLK
jgi:hypothetical protein